MTPWPSSQSHFKDPYPEAVTQPLYFMGKPVCWSDAIPRGQVITLPVPVPGLTFTFHVKEPHTMSVFVNSRTIRSKDEAKQLRQEAEKLVEQFTKIEQDQLLEKQRQEKIAERTRLLKEEAVRQQREQLADLQKLMDHYGSYNPNPYQGSYGGYYNLEATQSKPTPPPAPTFKPGDLVSYGIYGGDRRCYGIVVSPAIVEKYMGAACPGFGDRVWAVWSDGGYLGWANREKVRKEALPGPASNWATFLKETK